jgi:hypothetical protein
MAGGTAGTVGQSATGVAGGLGATVPPGIARVVATVRLFQVRGGAGGPVGGGVQQVSESKRGGWEVREVTEGRGVTLKPSPHPTPPLHPALCAQGVVAPAGFAQYEFLQGLPQQQGGSGIETGPGAAQYFAQKQATTSVTQQAAGGAQPMQTGY